MKRQWEPGELTEQWTLLPTDMTLLANKTGATRLGFAVLLPFFHRDGRFPQQHHEIVRAVVAHTAKQLGVPYEEYMRYGLLERLFTSDSHVCSGTQQSELYRASRQRGRNSYADM